MILVPKFYSADSGVGTLANKFGDTCGVFRKILRIGKFITNGKAIFDKLNTGKYPKLATVFDCLSILSETIYCFVDHVILLNKIGAYKFSDPVMKFVGFHENFLWLLETIFGILGDLLNYNEMTIQEKKEENPEALENLKYTNNIKKAKMLVNQLRLWGDFFVSSHKLYF